MDRVFVLSSTEITGADQDNNVTKVEGVYKDYDTAALRLAELAVPGEARMREIANHVYADNANKHFSINIEARSFCAMLTDWPDSKYVLNIEEFEVK